MIVLGLMGKIGSGKDTVADYLVEKHGFTMIGFGDVTREIAKEKGLEPTRENLFEIQKEKVEKHGKDFFPKKVAEMIRNRGLERVVVNGVRRPEDAETLKREFKKDFHLVLVDTDSDVRFERMKKRGRIGDPEEYRHFESQERREMELFGLDKTFAMAEKVIENNGTLEDLYLRTDKFISSLL